MRSRPRAGANAPAVAIAGLAVAAGAAIPRLPARARLVANVGVAAGGIAVARASGLSWPALGLGRASSVRGLRVGLAVGAPVVGVVAGSLAVPALRELYRDARVTEVSARRAVYEITVRIPLGTALSEELLFRGALFGAVRATWGTGAAVTVSSVVFGLWHVLPAVEAHASNPAGAELTAGRGGRSAHVGGTTVATALAGTAFAGLRLATGSVIAPTVVHAVLNGATYVASRWTRRLYP